MKINKEGLKHAFRNVIDKDERASLTKCRINANQSWRNCIKISDDLGKHMGEEKEIKVCKFLCNI